MNYGIPAGPCGMYTGGETEDYTVIISPPLAPIQYERLENSNATSKMSVYPNPSAQEIHFTTNDNIDGQACIRVYSTLGKMLIEKYTESRALFIGDLPEGYYIVSVTNMDKVYTSKFVVKK
jgi:hypothetical protein